MAFRSVYSAFVLPLFAFTIFLNAFLVFSVQPFVGKLLLPELGGTPAVWTTCQLFFQAVLLCGYGWAHLGVSQLGIRRHAWVQTILLFLTLAWVPFSMSLGEAAPTETNPIPWILTRLTFLCGLPFLVVTTGSPILQAWFSQTGHTHAKDPYFLYGASNLGSLLALLLYPIYFEPRFTLLEQAHLWAWGYRALLVALLGCLAWSGVLRSRSQAISSKEEETTGLRAAPTQRERLFWLACAFIPSSLMLGVTTYITTDISAIPLAWVVPLALYLFTFVLVFASRPWISSKRLASLYPAMLLAYGAVLFTRLSLPYWLQIGIHLSVFFVATMVCHDRLARTRPAAAHLTEYFLILSLGGVFGGLFNSALAPFLFDRIVEYPLLLVAPLFLLAGDRTPGALPSRIPAFLVLLVAGCAAQAALSYGSSGVLAQLGVFAAPAILASFYLKDSVQFARMMLAIALVMTWFIPRSIGDIVYASRNFYGPKTVLNEPEGRRFIHGGTVHGAQRFGPGEELVPRIYYHRKGPLSDGFDAFRASKAPQRIGLVGLGVGTIRTYGIRGDHWVCYEIDPEVVEVAMNPSLFTYMSKSQGTQEVVLGDARITLKKQPPQSLGMIVFDIFTSDAVPVHVITQEAMAGYLEKLAPGGVMMFNISNRYLDFAPLFRALAEDQGLFVLRREDKEVSAEDRAEGRSPAIWVALAREKSTLVGLTEAKGWKVPEKRENFQLWRDDFSNVLSLLRR